MSLLDSHAHITCDQLFEDLDLIIERAKEAGLDKILCMCTNQVELDRALKINNPMIDIAYGIYPGDIESASEKDFNRLENALEKKEIVAVGEIGLDYHFDNYNKELQQKAFIYQIKLANKYGVPFIVHMREATADTIQIIKQYSQTKVLIHCFSGSKETAEILLKLGAYLSYSGVVTFKNAKGVLDAVRETPLNRILIETDSPYLTPVPFRGKRNEPSYVKYTAERICELKNISLEELENAIHQNYKKLFQ